jgi:hypothetical protein
MQERNLAHHLLRQHNCYQRPQKHRKLLDVISQEPRTYRISLPPDTCVECPVPGCLGSAATRDLMHSHFAHRHPHDIITLQEEGLHGRCDRCDMFLPFSAMRSTHPTSKRCAIGAERKRKRLLDIENLRGQEIGFSVLGEELESVDCFNYLGRPLTVDGSDWPAVVSNINKARGRWARVSRVRTDQRGRRAPTQRWQDISTKQYANLCCCMAVKPGSSQKQSLALSKGFITRLREDSHVTRSGPA